MSYVLLPMSRQAIPQTMAERKRINDERKVAYEGNKDTRDLFDTSASNAKVAAQGNEEAALAAARAVKIEELPDEPFQEMSTEARVWKTYVQEADRWDKEMVDGRNNSMDVLLIFAALFSAISTAFIVESLNDLKPDPADSSAQTLLAISQTLAAMANGQLVSPPANSLDSISFSPTRSAVVVNVLWLISLSLSVAVSLIAMLAKDWCYRFMSGRFGQMYDQGRRRQQKWNGVERWRMEEVLSYLPGLMHLALLLFAVGLCIYLWSINLTVAVPVAAITVLITCGYAFATVMPIIDRYCPYNTSATVLLTSSGTVLGFGWKKLHPLVYRIIEVASWILPDQLLRWSCKALRQVKDQLGITNSSNAPELVSTGDFFVPMDAITSQMLSWIIVNCEESRSVSTALQAIAGARFELPRAPFLQCGAPRMVFGRLNALLQQSQKPGVHFLKDAATLPIALKYCRAYNTLMTGDAFTFQGGSWVSQNLEEITLVGPAIDMKDMQLSLLKYAEQANVTPGETAAAASTPVEFLRWATRRNFPSEMVLDQFSVEPGPEPGVAVSVLLQHIQGGYTLSIPALLTLIEHNIYYLIGWSKRPKRQKSSLHAILIHLFLTSQNNAPDVARTTAIILAAIAFAVNPYPGGEWPSDQPGARQTRAIQVLQHYRTTKPNDETVDALFLFGLVGLLPHIDLRLGGIQDSGVPALFSSAVAWAITHDTKGRIFGLPETFSLHLHFTLFVRDPLLANKFTPGENPQIVSALSKLLQAKLAGRGPDTPHSYVQALVVLRYTQSIASQDSWTRALSSLSFDFDANLSLKQFDDVGVVQALFEDSDNCSAPPAFMFYLRLLICAIMTLPGQPLSARRGALEPLLSCDTFTRLVPFPANRTPPTEKQVYAHALENIDSLSQPDAMLSTMQLVADFYYANIDEDNNRRREREWYAKLRDIESQFRAERVSD